jgi:hypothetical protein
MLERQRLQRVFDRERFTVQVVRISVVVDEARTPRAAR